MAVYGIARVYAAGVWRAHVRPPLVVVGRWLVIGFMLAGVSVAWRAARRTRALWRAQNANRESSALVTWGERGYRRHRKFRRRARRVLGWRHLEVRDAVRLQFVASMRFFACRGRRALPPLAFGIWRALNDCRARRLIFLNALAHGALGFLLAGLLRLL